MARPQNDEGVGKNADDDGRHAVQQVRHIADDERHRAASKFSQVQAAQEAGERGAGPMGLLMKPMRVGATFLVANEATTRSRIESIGGRDVVFKEYPKENN